MFFLAATLVEWIGGDFVYRKVAAKNIIGLITIMFCCELVIRLCWPLCAFINYIYLLTYSIYWWPSGKRSTNVNHSDYASSPTYKFTLWLKCLRPFWKKCEQGVEPFIILINSIKSSSVPSFFQGPQSQLM